MHMIVHVACRATPSHSLASHATHQTPHAECGGAAFGSYSTAWPAHVEVAWDVLSGHIPLFHAEATPPPPAQLL